MGLQHPGGVIRGIAHNNGNAQVQGRGDDHGPHAGLQEVQEFLGDLEHGIFANARGLLRPLCRGDVRSNLFGLAERDHGALDDVLGRICMDSGFCDPRIFHRFSVEFPLMFA